MSANADFTTVITLVDATKTTTRTVISVNGDATDGNLTRHRKEGAFSFSVIKKNRSATLTLRAKNGLFTKTAPLLVEPEAYAAYYVEYQKFQHTRPGEVGHPDAIGRVGELVRYEISEATQEADEKGELVVLSLIDIAQRIREYPEASPQKLQTPKDAFQNWLADYTLNAGAGAPFLSFSTVNIDLPDDQFIKQDWIPGSFKMLQILLEEIIQKVSKPGIIGGNFTDKYWFYVTHATRTNEVEVFAESVGTVSTGVILDAARAAGSQNVYEKKHSHIVNNKNFKNVALIRAANGVHTLPMAHAIFASDYAHATISDAWNVLLAYAVGDFVKFTNQLHRCTTITVAGESPATDPGKWENLSTATRHTPLTTGVDLWKSMLSGDDPTGDGFYVGMFNDMNIVVPNYDRTDAVNEFESVSIKDVEDFLTDPALIPSGEVVHGKRWLVNNGTGTPWAGHDGAVAQWDAFDEGGATWKFSVAPVLNDTVYVRRDGIRLKHNGTIWTTDWTLTANADKSSAFHPVKSIALATGPDGVANTAIEFVFDWNFVTKAQNLASRWAGWNFRLPAAPRAVGIATVGDNFAIPFLDTDNLEFDPVSGDDATSNGGVKTMNLGAIRGIEFKLEFDARDASNNRIDGMPNVPGVMWWRDLQDRVIYTDANIENAKGWGKIKADAGTQAKAYKLHELRTDELATIFGYVLPTDFTLKEKEFTGIQFDWNKVVEFGWFYKGSYTDSFFYKGAQNSFLDSFQEQISQFFSNLVGVGTGPALGNFIVDTVTLRISELRFLKDAIVSTESAAIANARIMNVNANRFSDFLTILGIGQGELARARHHPIWTPIDAYCDPRLRVGRTFVGTGTRWIGDPRTMTVAEYTIFEDSGGGTRMQVLGYEKFAG